MAVIFVAYILTLMQKDMCPFHADAFSVKSLGLDMSYTR
jgi:hypothetical protein